MPTEENVPDEAVAECTAGIHLRVGRCLELYVELGEYLLEQKELLRGRFQEAVRNSALRHTETANMYMRFARHEFISDRKNFSCLPSTADALNELEKIDPETLENLRDKKWLSSGMKKHDAKALRTRYANREPLSKRGARMGLRLSSTDVETFTTIVADVPWQYRNSASRGAAENHYPTMTMDELRAVEIPAAERAHLYLWVPNNFLREGFELLDAWGGFEYKTILTWVKPRMGLGNYFRSFTEHVLFATRGSLPTLRNDVRNVFEAPTPQHSRKPEMFYKTIVERASPGPYLELFARLPRKGWVSSWGDETPREDDRLSEAV